jgi:paraquat-inducible protein A
MHLEKKSVSDKARTPFFSGKLFFSFLAALYILASGISAWKIIVHTQASTNAIEQILLTYNLKNEGAKTLQDYKKEHPLLGMFISSPVQEEMKLPTADEANDALYSDVRHYLKTVRIEASVAAWWSWFLLNLSLFYVVTVVAFARSFTDRAVLFALTTVSLFCFFIGILAPAMVIWTAPTIPLETGNLEFVVQHQVRGIAAIIWDLLAAGHFIIGGFLLLFSIMTPLTKATLTYVATISHSRKFNYRIGQFLHTIGKWSMADVFVAAVLLALYALKFQQATKSIPCLGLYYFTGYCLLSLSTTELLVRSGVANGKATRGPEKKVGRGPLVALFTFLIVFIAATSVYTYEQYTVNIREKIASSPYPTKLNNSNLVLPAHKK